MTAIKPSSHGIVVDHVESGVRYAISDKNYNPKVNRKVRDLKPGETVRGFQPLRHEALGGETGALEATVAPENTAETVSENSDGLKEVSAKTGKATQTEGASSGASQDKKEGN